MSFIRNTLRWFTYSSEDRERKELSEKVLRVSQYFLLTYSAYQLLNGNFKSAIVSFAASLYLQKMAVMMMSQSSDLESTGNYIKDNCSHLTRFSNFNNPSMKKFTDAVGKDIKEMRDYAKRKMR